MNESVSISELERRMRPGAYSALGFLGPQESLAVVKAQDEQALLRLGLSFEQVADALGLILEVANEQRRNQSFSDLEQAANTCGAQGRKLKTASEAVPKSHTLSPEPHPASEREHHLLNWHGIPNPVPIHSTEELPGTRTGYLVNGKYQVFIAQWRGMQECPWGCEHGDWLASIDFLLLNRRSGKYVTGPGLIIHLIREHHFFEGKESPYRVDPAELAQVLELTDEGRTM